MRRQCINIVDMEALVHVLVKKWGNSACVRLPAAVMGAAKLSLDQPVDVREEAGRIILEPVREPVFDRTVLLLAVTEENMHETVDFRPPVGKEVL